MRDRLEIYWEILGPHAAELERRVDALARAMAGKDPAWYRGQRSRHGDPFAELEGIVREAWRNRLEYAAERVAVAGAAQQLPPQPGEDSSAHRSPTAEEMLESYRGELGEHRAGLVRAKARKAYGDFVRHQSPDWVRKRSRELADPYPSRAALHREIGRWVDDNRGPAATLFALERAERAAASREPSRREERSPAPPPGRAAGAEPRPTLLEGEALTARIEERREAIAADLSGLPEEELRRRSAAHARDFTERAAAMRAEALRLESEGAIAEAPQEHLLRRAVDAELSARAGDLDPVDRAGLESQGDYLRQQVVEVRRLGRALADLHGRWVDLHAEQAALQDLHERAPVAAKDAPGPGLEMD